MFDGYTPITIQGAQRAQTSGNQAQLYSFWTIYCLFSITYISHDLFQLSSSLFQLNTMLYPSRTRHNGDTGADVQQGPVPRILFRLRPFVNLFTISCWYTSLGFSVQLRRMLMYWHVATSEYCMYLDTRGLLLKALFSPAYVIKTKYLRECSASQVWPYMHQLRIMSWVNSWVARLLWLLS